MRQLLWMAVRSPGVCSFRHSPTTLQAPLPQSEPTHCLAARGQNTAGVAATLAPRLGHTIGDPILPGSPSLTCSDGS